MCRGYCENGLFEKSAAQNFCVRRVGEFPKNVWIPRANQIAGCLPLYPSPTDRNLPNVAAGISVTCGLISGLYQEITPSYYQILNVIVLLTNYSAITVA